MDRGTPIADVPAEYRRADSETECAGLNVPGDGQVSAHVTRVRCGGDWQMVRGGWPRGGKGDRAAAWMLGTIATARTLAINSGAPRI